VSSSDIGIKMFTDIKIRVKNALLIFTKTEKSTTFWERLQNFASQSLCFCKTLVKTFPKY
jgi:hypothetical protein